ncbi:MAG: peptide chain release factor N(5)-glutamine methyltransferase [Pyrinomonadaceae bacterium]
MAILSDLVRQAAEKLQFNGIPDPVREANLLMSLALGKDRAFIIANDAYCLTLKEEQRYTEFLERRAGREPYQHISGVQEFWKLEFIVTPDVLIPRHETELIVENALELFPEGCEFEFCEIGIGSGCISVSILNERERSTATAGDISAAALEIASINAKRHNVIDRLRLLESDIFGGFPDRTFDLIVSNPPYIPARAIENLQIEVRDHDPEIALTDGGDGLSVIKKIVSGAPQYLKPHGWLLMEIGYDQCAAVAGILDPRVWEKTEILPDLQGIPRVAKTRLLR